VADEDLYDLLGVPRDASQQDIKKAFRKVKCNDISLSIIDIVIIGCFDVSSRQGSGA
jgi:hypothetical protein